MEFSGYFQLKMKSEDVLHIFSEPQNLGKCIYGLESISFQENDFTCKLRFDLSSADVSYMSSISGKLKGHLTLENEGFELTGDGRAAGSKMSFQLSVSITDHNDQSDIHWKGKFDFGLIAKIMGVDKVRIIAHENIEKTIENLKNYMLGQFNP
jgi:Uncharacterized conserved protein